MERKQNSLVAGSEALDDLPGPVQARHHFTVADQVNQLVRASETDPDLGFMARHDGALLPAAQQPRQPAPVQARQRTLHALHDRKRRQQAPLRQPCPVCS